jgi:hypothetical protein
MRIRIPNTLFLLPKHSFSRNADNTVVIFTLQIMRHIQRLEKDRDVLLREDIISLYVPKGQRPFILFLLYTINPVSAGLFRIFFLPFRPMVCVVSYVFFLSIPPALFTLCTYLLSFLARPPSVRSNRVVRASDCQ